MKLFAATDCLVYVTRPPNHFAAPSPLLVIRQTTPPDEKKLAAIWLDTKPEIRKVAEDLQRRYDLSCLRLETPQPV